MITNNKKKSKFIFSLKYKKCYNLVMKLKIKKLKKNAKLPKFAHKEDAGLDLHCYLDSEINSGEKILIPTGIAMSIPINHVGLIWDKSGLALKKGIKVMGGVIDSGYNGEIKVIIINLSKKKHIFKAGEKIAQIIIQKVEQLEIEEVDNLEKSTREGSGFGSTGK